MQKTIIATLIASESMHVFCCVLPTVFSILSLLAGFGMMASMPVFVEHTHEILHAYEIPMIIFSAFVLAFGWGLYAYSLKLDCRSESACCHEPCAPKKDKTRWFMVAATLLLVGNVAVYMIFHRGMDEHFHVGETHDILSSHEQGHH